MGPVWSARGLAEDGGGDRGVAGMPGISDCPPLSPRPPAALPRQMRWGVWPEGPEGAGSKKKKKGKKNKKKTDLHKLNKCTKWVQTRHVWPGFGGRGSSFRVSLAGPGRKPSRMRH